MSTATAAVEEYDLVEALQHRTYLKLPLAVMQDVGPAVQTLGGLLQITNKETFSTVSAIASKAHVKVKTARNQLATLHDHAWIINRGREHTRRGAPRRSCTLQIPSQTRGVVEPYGILPWWATTKPNRGEPLTWASKAVLSVVMSRLAGFFKTVERLQGKADTYVDDIWGSIANLNGDDRHFLFSLRSLCEQTGLDHKSVIAAKNDLARRGIVRWTAFKRADNGDDKHALEPLETFHIITRPTGREGFVYVEWKGDGKNGQ